MDVGRVMRNAALGGLSGILVSIAVRFVPELEAGSGILFATVSLACGLSLGKAGGRLVKALAGGALAGMLAAVVGVAAGLALGNQHLGMLGLGALGGAIAGAAGGALGRGLPRGRGPV